MSRWTVARASIGCEGGCRRQIGAGEHLRLVTGREWPCCVECAWRRFQMTPPSDMPVSGLTPWAELGMSKLPRDFKLAQSKDGE